MGRPATRPAKLKDGFYIEVRNKGEKSGGIKIRRDDRASMLEAVSEYRRIKDITILGESKNDKWLEAPKEAV